MASYTPNYNLYKPANSDPHGDFISEFANNMDIIDAYLGSGGSGGVKILRSQSLSFTGLVATVSDSDITADSNYIVYYHDVTLAENAGITTVATSGVITFTATTAPSNTIVVDIVLLDVNGGGGGSGGHTIIDPLGQNMPSRTGLQFIGASVTDDSVNDKTVVTITGDGVHYSTSEQVIGTWIDGKTIYQRVLTGLSLTTSRGTAYTITIQDHGIAQFIDSICLSTQTQYRTVMHPPTWLSDANTIVIRSEENDTFDTLIIQYTKA